MKSLGLLVVGMAAQVSSLISFSEHVGDHMVLQRAPEKSGIYGTLNSTGSPTVTATVTPIGSGSPYQVTGRVSGNNWITYLKPTEAGGNYTISVTCDGCLNDGPNTIQLNDVTFGDVWYCGGQSNMALPLLHTFSRNDSRTALQNGTFDNIRLHQMGSNMNPPMPWQTALNATLQNSSRYETRFFSFSSTCYYFGQELSRLLGDAAPPIGLIHTAFGGSTAEQWTSNKTSIQCGNITLSEHSQEWFDGRVMPFSQMTVKGFVWYQGENDMGHVFGNSKRSTGYSCEVPKMVEEWRSVFSAEPGTTSPNAPFGLVTLASSGGEGHPDIGSMYLAQTGSYGDMPNTVFPNTFYAHAFDLADPFSNITCYQAGCCPNYIKPGAFCHGCDQYCESSEQAAYYMGPIHPRVKLPVGQRLAQACYGTVYEPGKVAVRGPIISGCSVSDGKLIVNFNKELLGDDEVTVGEYQRYNNASSFQVLTNSTLFCMQTTWGPDPKTDTLCLDDGTGRERMFMGVTHDAFDSLDTWPMVNINLESPTSISADVSHLGEIFGVRYAFFSGVNRGCCGRNDPTSGPCPVASCPVKASSGLPATPFIARIVNGKCECISPQVCDE